MKRINTWLALRLGDGLSNMWFFWFCVLLDLLELPPVISDHNIITWITFISQTVIQLIALPILGAQNKLQNESHSEIHAKLDAIHKHHGIRYNNKHKEE
jgi:hypothetical protein